MVYAYLMKLAKDLTGQKFGKLTVICKGETYLNSRGTKAFKWICECECGNEVLAITGELNNGKRTACKNCSGHQSNLVGKTFGKLTVLRKADEPYVSPGGAKFPQWVCRCECGNELNISTGSLTGKKRTACRTCSGSDLDLVGQRFGYLVVESNTGEFYTSDAGMKSRLWKCICDCGNATIVQTAKLRNGHIRSCGKCELMSLFIDLKGKRFDRVLVLEQEGWYQYPNSLDRDAIWRCLCDCGNEYTIRGNSLKADGPHSCICYRSEYRVLDSEMVGKKFGRLTVLSRAEDVMSTSGTKVNRWNCLCDCGRETIIRGAQLRNGSAYDCEFHSVSNNELRVMELLQEHGISYCAEKTFPDLLGDGTHRLRFDFFIEFDNQIYLIECQGAQHYSPVVYWGGQDAFERQLRYDAAKVEFARNNNYKLLIIDCSKLNVDIEGQVRNFLKF